MIDQLITGCRCFTGIIVSSVNKMNERLLKPLNKNLKRYFRFLRVLHMNVLNRFIKSLELFIKL